MGDFDTEPSSTFSLEETRRLIRGCATAGRKKPVAGVVEIESSAQHPPCGRHARPPRLRRLLRLLARDPKYPALLLAAAWLSFPRDSGAGLLCLVGAVALGKIAFDGWRSARVAMARSRRKERPTWRSSSS